MISSQDLSPETIERERRATVRNRPDPVFRCRVEILPAGITQQAGIDSASRGMAGPHSSRTSKSSHDQLWARVRDVSSEGIGLDLSLGVRPETPVKIHLRNAVQQRVALDAKVVHADTDIHGTCSVGCRFALPLGEDELQLLLARPTQQD